MSQGTSGRLFVVSDPKIKNAKVDAAQLSTKVLRRQSAKPKLLIVDDEPEIREIVREGLEAYFDVIAASDGKEAVEVAQRTLPDLILMDIMMPGMDGIAATETIRAMVTTRHIPIFILTAANTKDYRIRAFNFGADQFIGKPFDFEELTVRLLSAHKRSKQMTNPATKDIRFMNLEMNLNANEVRIDGARVELSPLEFDIVKLLILNREVLVTRAQIIDEVWKSKESPDRVMDAHIVSIRKKIAGFQGSIKTVYGAGYILRAD
jgi:two-component system OmpR family response regulator